MTHSFRRKLSLLLPLAALSATVSPALAHGDKAHASGSSAKAKEQKPWGIAGDKPKVQRTIEVRMSDGMRFTPDRINVTQGETIRFVVHNDGKVMHEFVLGTKAENDAHAQMMMKHPGMEHDEPYMAHVGPGKKEEIVWLFNRTGEFEFACLIAGHYQAGMVGRVSVTRGKS
jgi:uncharacterized cupredoxin-like copper-binding protein